MSNSTSHVSLLLRVATLCLMSSLYSVIHSEDALGRENSTSSESDAFGIGSFLASNMYVTLLDRDGHIGTADLFVVGKQHNTWFQTGIYGGPRLAGVGVGYRYLFKDNNSYRDWFLGTYAVGGFEAYANNSYSSNAGLDLKNQYDKNLSWDAGVELATARFQWTGNWYGMVPTKALNMHSLKNAKNSFSLRIATYYMQEMRKLGRINPFFFVGLAPEDRKSDISSERAPTKGGIGFYWEGTYLSLEGKLVWQGVHSVDSLIPDPQCGIRINFSGRTNTKIHHAKHRLFEMSQFYHPKHSLDLVLKESEVAASSD